MRQTSGEENGRHRLLRHYVRTAGSGITRRRAQRILDAAKIEAELANRARAEFLINMGHELRTPLNAIIGFADLIAQAPDGEFEGGKMAEYGSYIAGAGRHLLEVFSGILDIPQIDRGSQGADGEGGAV